MKKLFFLISFIMMFSSPIQIFCQSYFSDDYNDFGFERDFSIQVRGGEGPLEMPWVGGLNACQFCEIDLDLDGNDDLIVYERHGNRLLPFLKDESKENQLMFSPEYQHLFPPVREWINLIDYNSDGKRDIFTYTTGGIRVYKNISDTYLKFTLVEPIVYSFYFSGYVNLFALIDDYPVLEDMDGDGDIDILNFFTLGKYVNHHKNLSMEKYGVCDSLDFTLWEECWGFFEENESSNILTLGIDCIFDNDLRKERHSGSTLLVLDLNGDNLKDMLLGDVDFATVAALINGGTHDSAFIIEQDSSFPSYSQPINLISMPLCTYIDADNDDVKDLLVSPFDPGLDRTENLNSVLFYKNTGTNSSPYFELEQTDFLQDRMIDHGAGAYPVLYDMNGDGLQDLLIGNYGYLDSSYYSLGFLYTIFRSQIAYYKNTGSELNPEFELIDNDLAGISEMMLLGAYPALSDLDNDGDPDMVVGNEDGKLIYFENIDNSGDVPVFQKPVFNYQGIDVGKFSTPQLLDINRDGLTDLVVGKQNGTLSYYRNDGSAESPVFTLVSENFGGVDVTNINLTVYGYSTPCFFEHNGEYRLFAGSEFGSIYYYKDIEDNLDGDFTLIDKNYLYINEGYHNGLAVWNYNNDSYPDMLIGNYAGGLTALKGIAPSPAGLPEEPVTEHYSLLVYPNPAREAITISLDPGSPHEKKQIEIFNFQGVKEKYINDFRGDVTTINISDLNSGLYLVIVRMNGTMLAKEKIAVIR